VRKTPAKTWLLCLQCAVEDAWGSPRQGSRPAVGCSGGNSVCAEHAGAPEAVVDLPAGPLAPCPECHRSGHTHPPWLCVVGELLCIRHAAEAFFGEDDMGAHDMAHGLYLDLHAKGVRDAY
jgi:hypothetical protein